MMDEEEEDEVPFLARRRPVIPWRRHASQPVVHPDDVRRRLRGLPASVREELRLARVDKGEDAACDTLADAARLLAIPERDLRHRTTEDFIQACAEAGIPETTRRRLEGLHVNLVGRKCVWATSASGPEDPVVHRGAFYLSYPHEELHDQPVGGGQESLGKAAATALPGQLECRGPDTETSVLVAGKSMRLQQALENNDSEEAWEALKEKALNKDPGAKAACRRRVSGLYPLHLALCKQVEPKLSMAILKNNENACRVRSPDGRLPLHQALIKWRDFDEDGPMHNDQTELVGAILGAFPEACQEPEPLHGRLPLHCALHRRVADNLVKEIISKYKAALLVEDKYGKTPLQYCATARPRHITRDDKIVVDGCKLLTFPNQRAAGGAQPAAPALRGHRLQQRALAQRYAARWVADGLRGPSVRGVRAVALPRQSRWHSTENTRALTHNGLITEGFNVHRLYGLNAHNREARDDGLAAILERSGMAEKEIGEHMLTKKLVSDDVVDRVLQGVEELDLSSWRSILREEDEQGRTVTYLSMHSCSEYSRDAFGKAAINATQDERAEITGQKPLDAMRRQLDETREKYEESCRTLNEAEIGVSKSKLRLDEARESQRKLDKQLQNAKLACEDTRNKYGQCQRLADKESQFSKLKSDCLEKEQNVAEEEEAVEKAVASCTELQKEVDELRSEYDCQKRDVNIEQIKQQRDEQERALKEERLEEWKRRNAANREGDRLRRDCKSEYATQWYQLRPAVVFRLFETEKDRLKREAKAKAEHRCLLEDELTIVHGMDKATYSEVRTKMAEWYRAYEEQQASNGRSEATIEFEAEDLIALWIYSMGPGAKEPPNFCECGYRDTDLLTIAIVDNDLNCENENEPADRQAVNKFTLKELRSKAKEVGMDAQARKWKDSPVVRDARKRGVKLVKDLDCICPASPRNFRLYDKFNSCMRSMKHDDTCRPDFRRFHYRLSNAVEFVPGVEKQTTLFRGQPDFYGEAYEEGDLVVWKGYTSTTTKKEAAVEFLSTPTEEQPNPVLFIISNDVSNDLGASLSNDLGANAPCTLSAWPAEDEILLPAGASFKVKEKYREADNTWYKVKLEYLGQWKRAEPKCYHRLSMLWCCRTPKDETMPEDQEIAIDKRRHKAPFRELHLPEHRPKIPEVIDFSAVAFVSEKSPSTQRKSRLGQWSDMSLDVPCAQCADQPSNARHYLCPRSTAFICNAALLHLYNDRLERGDKLKHELTVWSPSPAVYSASNDELRKGKERCRIDNESYECVRERVREALTDCQVFNDEDDAIAASLWIKFERERSRHKQTEMVGMDMDRDRQSLLQTPRSQFPQLHAGLRNAVLSQDIEGGMGGCVLYRAKKENLTTKEDLAYRKGKTVQWADNMFVWDNLACARDSLPMQLGQHKGYIFVVKGIPEGKGAYFGRMKHPLPAARVNKYELLLPDHYCFRVSDRYKGKSGKDIGIDFIELESTGEDGQVQTVLHEDGSVGEEADDVTASTALPVGLHVADDVPQDPLEEEIWQAFDLLNFDANSPSGISEAELKDAIAALGTDLEDNEIKKIIEDVDSDGNGHINKEEFKYLMKLRIRDRDGKKLREDLKRAFEILDRDKSGKLSMEDLKCVVDKRHEWNDEKYDWDKEDEEKKISDEELRGMIEEASDRDGDQQIDDTEFYDTITPCLVD